MSAADIGTADWGQLFPAPHVFPRPLGWVIVDPAGRVEGWHAWCRGNAETAEQAHKIFAPRKRDRDKEIRDGWVVRREQPGDREALAQAVTE